MVIRRRRLLIGLLLPVLLSPISAAGAATGRCDQEPWPSFIHCRVLPAGSRVEWRVRVAGRLSWAVQPQGDADFTLVVWLFAPRPGGRFATEVQITTRIRGVLAVRAMGQQLEGVPAPTPETVVGGAGRLAAGFRIVVASDAPLQVGYTADPAVSVAVDRRWTQRLTAEEVDTAAGLVTADVKADLRGAGQAVAAVLPCEGDRFGAGSAMLTGPTGSTPLSCPGASSAVITTPFGARSTPTWRMQGSWVGPASTRFVLLTTAVD